MVAAWAWMSAMFDPYHKWLGIPLADQPPTHYRLLAINPFEADPDVIANAADQRMAHVKQYQAGRHTEHSQEILNQIATAKLCLLHPLRKAEYDCQLRESRARSVTPPAPSARPAASAPPVWTAPTTNGPRFRRAWETLWERDRFWQAVSGVAVVCLLGIGVLGFLLARGRIADQAEAFPSPSAASRRSPTSGNDGWPAQPPAARAASLPTAVRTRGADPGASQDSEDRSEVSLSEPSWKHADRDSATLPVPRVGETLSGRLTMRAPVDMRAARPGGRALGFPSGVMSIPPAVIHRAAGPVYLDDLKELIAEIGKGELGKHGATGYPADDDDYGSRAVVRGKAPRHLLSMHPPDQGAAYATYALSEDFRAFHALVGILEVDPTRSNVLRSGPLYMGEAFSALTFRVVGDGRVLWRSRPVRRSGEWQECNVFLQGVRLLELQVDCPGLKTFAWAAWVEPRLDP